jgi:acetyltransferase-like isoleucine patch superfamily enzyme
MTSINLIRSSEVSVAGAERSPESADAHHDWFHDAGAVSLPARLCHFVYRAWVLRRERVLAIPRNMFYSRLLRAQDIRLGIHSRIRGINRLQIGRAFKALDYLWLDAIERDRNGNQYKPVLVIGDNVVAGYFVHVAATNCVRIGSDVLIGSRVIITDHNHGIYKGATQSSPLERPAERVLTPDAETVVEDNVWIGDGVVILPGSHVGKGSIIGANSVVSGVIPQYCMAAGIPARVIRMYDGDSKSWQRIVPDHAGPRYDLAKAKETS